MTTQIIRELKAPFCWSRSPSNELTDSSGALTMDIIDTAAEIEELQRNAALSAHRVNAEAAHENAKAFHDKCENKDLRVCGRG